MYMFASNEISANIFMVYHILVAFLTQISLNWSVPIENSYCIIHSVITQTIAFFVRLQNVLSKMDPIRSGVLKRIL